MQTSTNHESFSIKAKSALSRTANWIERFGGRLAGSEACRKTAEAIQADFSKRTLKAATLLSQQRRNPLRSNSRPP